MNISYKWLKDLIEINLPPEEIADRLTRVGLAVEGIHPHDEDFVLDVDLTSNRPDCLSQLGVAREISVVTDSKFKIPDSKTVVNQKSEIRNLELVRIVDSDLCYRFTARIFRNVKIAPSPKWMKKRLEAIGERAINNVADVSNYVMHELGQPMHAFDLDKLAENRIVMRRARLGETIKTLDEIERKLDENVLAICDAEKPVAIGGVMGGFDTGISENTRNVLLEVAYFNRQNIRQTSRKLNLTTEASYRFERGVDIENLIRSSNRATELICELAGGDAGEFVDVYPTKLTANRVESQDISAAVKRLTGLDVETDKCLRILDALGISQDQSQIANRKSQIFVAPTWRHDIAIEEDLVEEVARHTGYENIAEELPPAFGAGEYQPNEMRKLHLRQTLTALGFDETISYSFIDTSFDEMFELVPGLLDERSDEKLVTLKDSVIEGAVRMRPSLLPGLLDAARTNFNQRRSDLRLFEIGNVFAAKTDEADNLPNEREIFSLVVTGGHFSEGRAMPTREMDFFDIKGSVEAAMEAVGIANIGFRAVDVKHLRKGQAAAIFIDEKQIGYIGRLSDEISANYKFRQPVYAAELDLQYVLQLIVPVANYRPLPKYPSVIRDVSFLTKRDVSFAEIRGTIDGQKIDICRKVEFVDVYEGKGMAAGERSITIRLEYRSDERTLIDEEVDAIHSKIIGSLENILGIKQRS